MFVSLESPAFLQSIPPAELFQKGRCMDGNYGIKHTKILHILHKISKKSKNCHFCINLITFDDNLSILLFGNLKYFGCYGN